MASDGRRILWLVVVASLLPVASGFCSATLGLQRPGPFQQRLRPATGLRKAQASIGRIHKDGRVGPKELQLQPRMGTVTVAIPLRQEVNIFERICMVRERPAPILLHLHLRCHLFPACDRYDVRRRWGGGAFRLRPSRIGPPVGPPNMNSSCSSLWAQHSQGYHFKLGSTNIHICAGNAQPLCAPP